MAARKKKERKHKTGTPFAGARHGLRIIRPKGYGATEADRKKAAVTK